MNQTDDFTQYVREQCREHGVDVDVSIFSEGDDEIYKAYTYKGDEKYGFEVNRNDPLAHTTAGLLARRLSEAINGE